MPGRRARLVVFEAGKGGVIDGSHQVALVVVDPYLFGIHREGWNLLFSRAGLQQEIVEFGRIGCAHFQYP